MVKKNDKNQFWDSFAYSSAFYRHIDQIFGFPASSWDEVISYENKFGQLIDASFWPFFQL